MYSDSLKLLKGAQVEMPPVHATFKKAEREGDEDLTQEKLW